MAAVEIVRVAEIAAEIVDAVDAAAVAGAAEDAVDAAVVVVDATAAMADTAAAAATKLSSRVAHPYALFAKRMGLLAPSTPVDSHANLRTFMTVGHGFIFTVPSSPKA